MIAFDRTHRFLTQEELDALLADAYRRGAEAMREAAANVPYDAKIRPGPGWRLESAIRALPIPEGK